MKRNKLIKIIFGAIGLIYYVNSMKKYIAQHQRDNSIIEKLNSYFSLQNQWIELKSNGISLEKYFVDNEIKAIAIYGFGEIGKRLYEELKKSKVDIQYIIDQNATNIKTDIPILKKTDTLKEVDALIVTATFYYNEIEREMSKKINFPIISLEEIIYGL